MFVLAFVLVAVAVGGLQGGRPGDRAAVLGLRILARTDDRAMPHIWDMFARFGEPEVRGGADSDLRRSCSRAAWYSFRCSLRRRSWPARCSASALAVLMARFRVFERALHAVPGHQPDRAAHRARPADLLADGAARAASWPSETWLAAVLLGVFLAFFPVAMGTLRGLQTHARRARWS